MAAPLEPEGSLASVVVEVDSKTRRKAQVMAQDHIGTLYRTYTGRRRAAW